MYSYSIGCAVVRRFVDAAAMRKRAWPPSQRATYLPALISVSDRQAIQRQQSDSVIRLPIFNAASGESCLAFLHFNVLADRSGGLDKPIRPA